MTEAKETTRARMFARTPNAAAPQGRDLPSTPPPSSEAANVAPHTAPKAPTKAETVIQLLQRPLGASLEELVGMTGWLPHTTRAALTGLRKKGHAIAKDKVDDVTRYTIGPSAKS
jgi:hypothetical protein